MSVIDTIVLDINYCILRRKMANILFIMYLIFLKNADSLFLSIGLSLVLFTNVRCFCCYCFFKSFVLILILYLNSCV